MPKIVAPKLDIPNLASKLPSPLQKPVGFALEGLKQALGGDDPSSIMQVGAPMVSIYKDAAGVPSAVLRAEGTKNFLQSAKDTAINGIDTAAELFAEKYPRIAAHMHLKRSENYGLPMMAQAHSPYGKVAAPINISMSPEQPYPLNVLTHEGTHVAQSLGNSDALALYDFANEHKDLGYPRNPFEHTADYAGELAEATPYINRPNMNRRPPNAIKALKSLMESDKRDYINKYSNPKQRILDILKRRELTPMKSHD